MVASELSSGDDFAGYVIERALGRGGMGAVYVARQPSLERNVALKVIRSDLASNEEFRARFGREARLAASVEHPNVVGVHDAGEHDGQLYIVMRFVEGSDLASRVSYQGALTPTEAARVISQVAEGLDAIHAAGLVHRDVKPANVLLDEAGQTAYLTDFGLARPIQGDGASMTATGRVIGTVDYMAPEAIAGKQLDARADVYSLGAVLVFALTGGKPYPRSDARAAMWAHVNEPPPAPGEVRPEAAALDPVIARAMAKERDDRYPSAGDFGRALLAAIEGEAVTEPEGSVGTGEAALVATRTTQVARPARNRKIAPLAAAAAVILAGVVAALLATGIVGGGEEGGPKGATQAGNNTNTAESNGNGNGGSQTRQEKAEIEEGPLECTETVPVEGAGEYTLVVNEGAIECDEARFVMVAALSEPIGPGERIGSPKGYECAAGGETLDGEPTLAAASYTCTAEGSPAVEAGARVTAYSPGATSSGGGDEAPAGTGNESKPVGAPFYCRDQSVSSSTIGELVVVVTKGEIVCDQAEDVLQRYANDPPEHSGSPIQVAGTSWICIEGGEDLKGRRIAKDVGFTCDDTTQVITAYLPR